MYNMQEYMPEQPKKGFVPMWDKHKGVPAPNFVRASTLLWV